MSRTRQWRWTKLGSVATFTNGGAWNAREYVESGIPVVRVTDCQNGTVDISACKYLPEAAYAKYRRHEIAEGDLIVATVGSHPTQPGSVVGRPIVVPREVSGAFLNQNAVCIRPIAESILSKRFLSHFAKVPSFSEYVISCARGSANQVRMAIGLFKEMPIELPPLPTQRKIAAILSAYDDLIENNLRRIKILEEMAQNLYREWFVKFRFPGHEHARFVDSPLGRIPEGWGVKRLGDHFLIVLGGTPSRNEPDFWRNGTVPWINSGKVNDVRVTEPSELITEHALRKSAAKLMPPETTLIAITGATLGQVSILEIEACANQSVVGVISEYKNLVEWLHLTIRERISSIINHASGGAQQHINKGIVEDVVVAVPPENIAEGFRNFAHPLYRQIAGLIFKNITLRRTRDLLLPKLISGEVDVSELDIAVPEENS